jgi:hypothetical protein
MTTAMMTTWSLPTLSKRKTSVSSPLSALDIRRSADIRFRQGLFQLPGRSQACRNRRCKPEIPIPLVFTVADWCRSSVVSGKDLLRAMADWSAISPTTPKMRRRVDSATQATPSSTPLSTRSPPRRLVPWHLLYQCHRHLYVPVDVSVESTIDESR